MFWLGLICCSSAILASLAIVLKGLWELQQATKSKAWPATTGIITSFELDEDDNLFQPLVTYEYLVDGEQLQGQRIEHGLILGRARAQAEAASKQYSKDSQIDVYYNPANPHSSVLKPGRTLASWMELMIGIALLAVSSFLSYASLSALNT